jgi:hypothetical protein
MRKALPILAALSILAGSAAIAQTITIQPAGSDPAPVRITVLRVTVTTSLAVPGSVGDLAQQRTASEAARRAVYEMMAQECRSLSEAFKADCRIASVNATTSMQARHAGSEGIQVNGTGTFELTGRPN